MGAVGRGWWGQLSRAANGCHDNYPRWPLVPTGSGAPREVCCRTDVISVLQSAQKRVFVRPSALCALPSKRTGPKLPLFPFLGPPHAPPPREVFGSHDRKNHEIWAADMVLEVVFQKLLEIRNGKVILYK